MGMSVCLATDPVPVVMIAMPSPDEKALSAEAGISAVKPSVS